VSLRGTTGARDEFLLAAIAQNLRRMAKKLCAMAPGWRRQGLSRRLIDWVLDLSGIEGHPIILFGNDSVIDFYPRFGFRRVVQWRFTDIDQVEPVKRLAGRLDVRRFDDRIFLAQHCRRALPTGRRFGARNYHSALLFHLTAQELPVYWLDREQAVVIARHEGDRLVVHDLLPTQPFHFACGSSAGSCCCRDLDFLRF
jgi:GNAT superfamily N-acetyltransferase